VNENETPNETIVIEHEKPNRRPDEPPHTHHNRLVDVKQGADSVTIPPTYMLGESMTFKRTEDKTREGLPIFRVALP
jgi:hypothetical protein